MALKRMDNVGIVVEGEWAGRVTGQYRSEIEALIEAWRPEIWVASQNSAT